jgi:hypothetical protein
VRREQLVQDAAAATGSASTYGAVASLLRSRGNAYGRVFQDVDGRIGLHPSVEHDVLGLKWRVG